MDFKTLSLINLLFHFLKNILNLIILIYFKEKKIKIKNIINLFLNLPLLILQLQFILRLMLFINFLLNHSL